MAPRSLNAQIRLQAAAALELRRRERLRAIGASHQPQLPPWAKDFDRPARYKVAYGGRGSAKSHTFCRKLLQRAADKPLRILCARELQISIKDSVHRLLSDLVSVMGMDDKFEVGQSYLRGKNGSDFLFKGLRHNASEIKSTEGIDIAFVEEASSVSDASWALLIPTIRAPNSEIWAIFNPDQVTDPAYRRFVIDPPDNAIVRKVNYDDNPWFPPELEAERAYLARVDPDAYAHVWLGECRTYTDAQVLNGKWNIDVFNPGSDWHGPYYGADWGFAQDPTALVKCWVHERKLYIEHEAWGVEVSLDNTPALFDRVPDARDSIVRADSARPETINHLRERGYVGMTAVHKWQGSVEDGVEFLRSFEQIVIHERCKHAAEEARLWSFKTDRLTGDVLPVLKPGSDHCIAAGQLVLTARGDIPIEQVMAGDFVMTRAGWRPVVRAWQASPSREVWEIKAGGKTLIATPDHEVYTVGRKFVRVDALRYGDELLVNNGEQSCQINDRQLRWSPITERLIGATRKAKALLIEGILSGPGPTTYRSICTIGCTSTITEKSSPVVTSTTLMAIPATTTLKTWFASRWPSMCMRTGPLSGKQGKKSIAPRLGTSQRLGMPAKRVAQYIARLVALLTKTLYQLPSNASIAERIFKRAKWATTTCFVPMLASRRGVVQPEWMTKTGFASFAAKSLPPINTKRSRLVPCPVEAVLSLQIEKPVYDLAVLDCHEFVASGVLVSNCWDAVRYALEPMIRQRKSALYLFEEGRMNEEQEHLAAALPGISPEVLQRVGDVPGGACGRCSAFSEGWCEERQMLVGVGDPGCVMFDARRLAA